MIITRSPLRVSLGGGGTDLPTYYSRYGGSLVAAAIDKYSYVALHRPFESNIILNYLRLERVSHAAEVQHPIIREALLMTGVEAPVEITCMADVPPGTGLGSSGSFTTALLRALYAFRMQSIPAPELAAQACMLEIERLGEPVGKQDQYIAAYGGITAFTFLSDGKVEERPLSLPAGVVEDLEENLLLFFTGYARQSSSVLAQQDARTRSGDSEMVENLHFVKQLGEQSLTALERADLPLFAQLMNSHWEHKKKRSYEMSNPQIDEWYEQAMSNGALGGKLVGAGGGGFLMFYAGERDRLRRAMREAELTELPFRFDFEGTKVMLR